MDNTTIKFTQLNCNRRVATTCGIGANKNEIYLLQEPRFTANGNIDVKLKRKCFAKKKARAAIYAPNLTDASILPIDNLITRDCAAALLENPRLRKPVIIASIYCDQKSRNAVTEDLKNLVHYSDEHRLPLIIGGDVNAWSSLWFSPRENARGNELEAFFLGNGVNIKNTHEVATRVDSRDSSWTIVDITGTRGLENDISKWRVDSAKFISDHKPIHFELDIKKVKEKKKIRGYSKVDWVKFKIQMEERIPKIKGLNDRWSESDIETAWGKLHKCILTCLDKNGGHEREIRPNVSHLFWNEDCEETRNEHRQMEREVYRSKRHPTEQQYSALKELWKKHTKAVRKARKESWREFTSSVNDIHSMAKVTKIVRSEPLQDVGLLKKENGAMCTSASETIDVLLKEHFPQCDLGKQDDKRPSTNRVWIQDIPWINIERVKKAISEFGPLKACGKDGIKPTVLQNLPDVAIESIMKIFTAIMTLSYTPKDWRTSIVEFITKPGKTDMTDPRSYRPISLLSHIFKTLERLTLYHLDETAFRNKPMHRNQFAFRKDMGTDNALSNTVNEIERGLANNEYVILVLLDIKGAFDNVNTAAIITAMENHGIPDTIQRWYTKFLQNRYSETTIGLQKGRCKNNRGFPQGGVTSAPWWNLCMDDLLIRFDGRRFIIAIKSTGFADDYAGVAKDKNKHKARKNAQLALDEAVRWAVAHGLEFSHKKTQVLFITRRRGRNANPPAKLKLYGEEIEYSETAKYLGVTIDDKLCWRQHLKNKVKSAKRIMMACKTALARTWGPQPKYMKWLYTAVIRPQITYGCYVWAKSTKIQYIRDWLRSLQRLGLTMIGHVRRSCPTSALELIYDVKPLHIAIKEIAMNTYFRVKHFNWTAKTRGQCGHEEYAYNLLPERIKKAVTDRVPFQRKWNKPYTIEIGSGKGPEERRFDFEVYTDGSLVSGSTQAGSGVIIKKDTQWLPPICAPLKDATVFQSELKAIELAGRELINIAEDGDIIRIFVDSQAALLALNAVEFRQWSVEQAYKALEELSLKGCKINLEWVRAHIGIEGNERADKAANEGRQRNDGFVPVKTANSSIRIVIYNWGNEQWANEWERETNPLQMTPKCRQTRYFYKTPSKSKAKILLSYNRERVSMLVRYTTGHAFLKRHNMIVEKGTTQGLENEDIYCSLCESPTEWETPHHVICSCPALMHRRISYFGKYFLDNDPSWKMKVMLDFLNCMIIMELEGET